MILDPVAKTHIDYTSDIKVAHVMPLPTPTTLTSRATGAMSAGFSGSAVGPASGATGFFLQGQAIEQIPMPKPPI
jgi:hypothetical protein